MRIGILGTGAAGLSAAYCLRGSSHQVSIHEASADVGGLARSFRWHGFDCDLAPHRLYCEDATVLAELARFTPLRKVRRRSRIYIAGRWLSDPLSASGLLLRLPARRAWSILRSYLSRPDLPEDSFAALARNRFGDELYEMFFRPYSEKLFGVPADQIAASWGRRKLRLGPPLRQWRRASRLHFRHFHYPRRGGYGAICRGLREALPFDVRLRSKLIGISRDAGGLACTFDEDGQTREEHFDLVISSLPVTYLAALLGAPTSLRFRPMRLVYLLVSRPRLGHDQWFYFADADKMINRVAEFKNFASDGMPPDTSVLCCEITDLRAYSFSGVVAELTAACGLRDVEILDDKIIDLERAYPVYDLDYEEQQRRVDDFFADYPGIVHLGRGAQFIHQDLDEIFVRAKRAVTAILNRR